MKQGNDTCAQCFESGTEVRQRAFAALPPALGTFANADKQGLQPAICQRHDDSFRVCFETQQSNSAPCQPPLGGGKSWLTAMLERLGKNFHF